MSSQPKCYYFHKNNEFQTSKQGAQPTEFILGF